MNSQKLWPFWTAPSEQKVTEIFIGSFATKSDVHKLETKLVQDIHKLGNEIQGVKRDFFWLKWGMGIGFTFLLMIMLAGFTWLANENVNTRQELKAEMDRRFAEQKAEMNKRFDELKALILQKK